MSSDWMPSRRSDQLAMAKNWSAILATKAAAWEILVPEVTILSTKTTNSEEVLQLSQSSQRTATTNYLKHSFANFTALGRERRREI